MLSISTIGAGAAKTAQYYTESHAQTERYYDSKMEQSGVWVGGRGFGLHGQKVDGETFKALLDGRDTQGKKLVPDKDGTRRVGYDFTFSADKSVSVLWARADSETREKIENVFRKSVENSLKYIEKDILNDCVRRGKDGLVRESPKELTFATFQHGSSRAGDPQLHMHCVLLNMAERRDGSWGAIDPKQAFKSQVLARKMFAAEFSTNLHRELGLGIKQTKDGFRIEGVPEEIIKHYSKRKQEIEERAQALGVSSARGRERIALDTRDDKQEIAQYIRLSRWQTEMETKGFSWDEAKAQCLSRKITQNLNRDELVGHVLRDFTAHNSTFTEKAFKQKLAENAQGLATIDELKKVFSYGLAKENVIRLELDEWAERRFTTIEILTQEKEMMIVANELHKTHKHKVSSESAAGVFEMACKAGMSAEQRAAAEFVIESGSIALVQGVAGSGKSFTMKTVKEVYEQQGYTVRGLAPTGKAAAELSIGSGIDTNTIDKYFYDKNKNGMKFSARDIVIVDEAGMIGSAKMRELVNDVEASGAKLVLVGDDRQLQPIDFGNPFRAFREKMGAAEINTIRRQKETWQREAATDFRESRAQDGILKYQEHEALKLSQTIDEVRARVTEDFVSDKKKHGGSQLILSSTNALTNHINEDVRMKLKETGELGGREFKVSVRGRHGSRMQREFCEGERIYFTKNNRALGVQNGALGQIDSITKDKIGGYFIKATLDNGHKVTFNTRDYDRFDYGYAVTIHKSQGATVDRTYVVATYNMDREAAYVAMTRHREASNLYGAQESFERMKVEGHGKESIQLDVQEKTTTLRMSDSFARSNQKELSLDYIEQKEAQAEVKQQMTVELLTTKEHRALAQTLASKKLSRDEISNTLRKIAMTPAGVDNPYRSYPAKQTEWQIKAVQVLKAGDFSESTIKNLSQQILNSKVGEQPILTLDERERLGFFNKNISEAHRYSLVCNREFEKEYVTASQKNIANQLLNQKLTYNERAALVRQLYVEPTGVSPEMKLYASHNAQVQIKAGEILSRGDLSTERLSQLSALVNSKEIGDTLNDKQRLEIMKERSIKIENDFTKTIKIYQEHELKQKNEFKQEFKTVNHDKIAAHLEIQKWMRLSWQERAEVVSMLACEPRGIGKEFGGHNSELLSFQKKARTMLMDKDLSRVSCKELIRLVQGTELGLLPTQKQQFDQSLKLSKSLEPHMQEAAAHSQKQEIKQRQTQDRGRGHSMGR